VGREVIAAHERCGTAHSRPPGQGQAGTGVLAEAHQMRLRGANAGAERTTLLEPHLLEHQLLHSAAIR
jgi:hypothetical protein